MGRKRVKHDSATKRDKYVVNVSYSFYCYFTFSEVSVSFGTYCPLYLEKNFPGLDEGKRERGEKRGREERGGQEKAGNREKETSQLLDNEEKTLFLAFKMLS